MIGELDEFEELDVVIDLTENPIFSNKLSLMVYPKNGNNLPSGIKFFYGNDKKKFGLIVAAVMPTTLTFIFDLYEGTVDTEYDIKDYKLIPLS